jgi:2-polyprenyl-6-hydroxyphenyl methylase/3-demethylubiquinone-9 3-methyltransferase
MTDLLKAEGHFEFGENWTNFVDIVEESHKENAVAKMRRLFPDDELRGANFLDIGCGSGLHSLAAARLGVGAIHAIDIDPNSVSAARRVVAEIGGKISWEIETISVFDLPPGQFDIVYSWGVLHHTGDMWRAVHAAAQQVRPGGLFAIALYRKTPFCRVWRVEKAIYTRAPEWLRAPWRWAYTVAHLFGMTVCGRNPLKYIREYKKSRGMSFYHDVHDWLGGYPYESAAPDEVRSFVKARGFSEVRSFMRSTSLLGLFGTGNDEFVFRREH